MQDHHGLLPTRRRTHLVTDPPRLTLPPRRTDRQNLYIIDLLDRLLDLRLRYGRMNLKSIRTAPSAVVARRFVRLLRLMRLLLHR